MKMRRFFWLSLILVACAFVLEIAAQDQFGHGARFLARSVVRAEHERDVAGAIAMAYRTRGTAMSVLGFTFAVASLTLVILSARKHEPAWRSVVVALLTLYVIL